MHEQTDEVDMTAAVMQEHGYSRPGHYMCS